MILVKRALYEGRIRVRREGCTTELGDAWSGFILDESGLGADTFFSAASALALGHLGAGQPTEHALRFYFAGAAKMFLALIDHSEGLISFCRMVVQLG